MGYLPVHWSEGMFLRPHHFQAADRYWTELTQTSEAWDHPYNYGIRSIELSQEAIANFHVQVTSCEARMQDGTILSLRTGQEPDRVDLKAAFETDDHVRVFLAIPRLHLGRANVTADDQFGTVRYAETAEELPDESRGGSEQEISFRDLNVRILLSTQDSAGYELLPIAEIQRAGESEAVPSLDSDYIPPVLAIDAWPALGRDIVRAIYDIVGKRLEEISKHVTDHAINLATTEPTDLQRVLLLMRLNESYAVLRCLAFARGVHPFVAYVELCRIVGLLSYFRDDRRVPELPLYDHDDLARVFQWLKRQIEELVHCVEDPHYVKRVFVGVGQWLQVLLEEEWFTPDWQWFIGVHHGKVPADRCRNLLKRGNLNYKITSASRVERAIDGRVPSLVLGDAMPTPRGLPIEHDWLYYHIDQRGPAWKLVDDDRKSLALWVSKGVIANQHGSKRQEYLDIVERGESIRLQFALFLVKRH